LALSISTGAGAFVSPDSAKGKNADVMQEQAREGSRSGGHVRGGHVRGGHGAHRPQVQMRGNQHRRGHNWGSRVQGRWHAGHRAPGGWQSYQRPFVGYQLPRYWVNPSYYIVNYSNYGFQAPQQGYQWVRYYDDAVLTDPRGYVVQAQPNVQWENYGDSYADAEYGESVVVEDDMAWEEDGSVYAGNGPAPAPYGTTYEEPAYAYQPVSNAPSNDPCDAPYQSSGQVYDRSGRADCATGGKGKGYAKGYTKGAQVEHKEVYVTTSQPQYQAQHQAQYQPAQQPQAAYYPAPQPAPQPQYRPAPPHHGGQMVMQPAYYPAQQPMYYMVYPQPQQTQPTTTTVVVNAGGGGGSYTETTTTVTETDYYETTPKKKRHVKRKAPAKAKPSCRCS
jgi:Ni/Co efflux regulator RcnB